MKKMYFVSAHEPTKEQIEDAKRMGYELIPIKSPILQKNSNIPALWNDIFQNKMKDIAEGDAIVIMGEPRWIGYLVYLWTLARAYHDGYPYRPNINGIYVDKINLMTTFTERQAIEEKQPDGTITKKSVFKHGGFVPIEFFY